MGDTRWVLQREVMLQAVELFMGVNTYKNDGMAVNITILIQLLLKEHFLIRLSMQILKGNKLAQIKGRLFLRIANRLRVQEEKREETVNFHNIGE